MSSAKSPAKLWMSPSDINFRQVHVKVFFTLTFTHLNLKAIHFNFYCFWILDLNLNIRLLPAKASKPSGAAYKLFSMLISSVLNF